MRHASGAVEEGKALQAGGRRRPAPSPAFLESRLPLVNLRARRALPLVGTHLVEDNRRAPQANTSVPHRAERWVLIWEHSHPALNQRILIGLRPGGSKAVESATRSRHPLQWLDAGKPGGQVPPPWSAEPPRVARRTRRRSCQLGHCEGAFHHAGRRWPRRAVSPQLCRDRWVTIEVLLHGAWRACAQNQPTWIVPVWAEAGSPGISSQNMPSGLSSEQRLRSESLTRCGMTSDGEKL